MSIGFWETVSRIGFIAAVLLLIITVILLWKLQIPSVWQELTGQRERKEVQKLNEKPAAYVNRFSFPMDEEPSQNTTELLAKTEKLVDAQIQDETKLLEEFSYIPVKQAEVEFEMVKDEISVYQEENVTALLKQ